MKRGSATTPNTTLPPFGTAISRGAGLSKQHLPLFLLAFALTYFFAAKLGIATSLPPEGIVILWPPNAIVLAALLSARTNTWWLFGLVTVATEIAADVPDYPLWAAAAYGIVNFSEAALAAALLSRFNTASRPLEDGRDFVRFLLIGPVLASGIASLFGAAVYKIGSPSVDYLHYWRVFWLGDALGLIVVGTTLLAWRRPADAPTRSDLYARVEGTILCLGLLAASSWALLADADMPAVYLVFPFLVWAAFRFGVRGASVAIVAVAAIAIGSAVNGRGPFAGLSQIDAVVALQGLIAVVALTTFLLAFVAEASHRALSGLQSALQKQSAAELELRSAYEALEEIKRGLDETVAERTAALRGSLARNEMLLREVHHRVKNNLQLVSSLVGAASRSEPDARSRMKFVEVQAQIRAIAATYDVLLRMDSVDVADYCKIVSELCRHIQAAHPGLVSISTEGAGNAPVSADAAVALSLAINELITNSMKHAAPGREINIAVSCKVAGERLRIGIADDGTGFGPGFDLERAKGFGLQMARMFIEHAGGQIHVVERAMGAAVEISVPTVGTA